MGCVEAEVSRSSDLTITIGIVGHIARGPGARKLMHTARAAFLSLDNGTYGADANHRRTWERLSTTTTPNPDSWLVVLEDDAVPCDDFRNQLEEALAVAPAQIVSLYLGQQRPPQFQWAIEPAIEKAEKQGAAWLVGRQLIHAVGVAIRADLVPAMLDDLDREFPIDESLNLWVNKRMYRVAYPIPSLIDHADGETLIKHRDGQPRDPGRVAWRFGARSEWNRDFVDIGW